MIKELYTISNNDIYQFSEDAKRIAHDLESDGLEVEIKFSTAVDSEIDGEDTTVYSAMIIGRTK